MDEELRAFEICSPILEKVFLSCNFSFLFLLSGVACLGVHEL